MAEEKTEEKETPEASAPEAKETADVETPETAEKPEKTPEVETEEGEKEDIQEEKTEAEKTVPLRELQKERERRRIAEGEVIRIMQNPQNAPPEGEKPVLDPDVVPALDEWYEARRNEEKVDEFVKKNAEALKDPILDGTVRRLIDDAAKKGKLLEPEDALAKAKELLDTRLKPEVEKASEEKFKEGQKIGLKKDKAGAIGDTQGTASRPEKKEEDMTAEEYAEYHKLSRV